MQSSTNARGIYPNPPRSHTSEDVQEAQRTLRTTGQASAAEQGSLPGTPAENPTGSAAKQRKNICGRMLVSVESPSICSAIGAHHACCFPRCWVQHFLSCALCREDYCPLQLPELELSPARKEGIAEGTAAAGEACSPAKSRDLAACMALRQAKGFLTDSEA
jgi:hypothetical protein